MPALALWTPEDGLLGALAPIGAALSSPPALVIDLDTNGPAYPGEKSLADMVREGPTKADLDPGRGIALLRNGGVSPGEAVEVAAALLDRWERVVLRLPPRPTPQTSVPLVPVRLLVSGWYAGSNAPAVWQSTPEWAPLPAPGVRLPVPERATVRALLRGQTPIRSRWVSAWRSVWRAPWGR